jgi:hypothetical protein
MKQKAVAQLELDARWAYVTGTRWEAYWATHHEAIRQAEPYNRRKYRRLVNKLLAILVSGHAEQTPIDTGMLWGSEPWEADDVVTADRLTTP